MRIEAEQLCVDYNGTVALYDASLKLPAGCICGLVGMNGAQIHVVQGADRFCSSIERTDPYNQRIGMAQRHQMVAYVPQSESIDSQFLSRSGMW